MKISLWLVCLLSITITLVECDSEKLPDHLQERLTTTPSNGDVNDNENSTNSNCPTCQPSTELLCKLRARGCITTNAFGHRLWYPDPCTLCDCSGCSKIECPKLNCFGFPTATRPGRCCSECDFGVSEYNCSVVPVKVKSIYVSLGDNSCQSDVVMHDCNQRFGTDRDGKSFRCVPFERRHTHNFGRKCRDYAGVVQVRYKDVGICSKEEFNETMSLSNQFPQDVVTSREKDGGLPRRCIEYFASQQQQQQP